MNNELSIITYLTPLGRDFQEELKYYTEMRDGLLEKLPQFREDIIDQYEKVIRSAISDNVTKAINVPIDDVIEVVEELNLSIYLEDDKLR